MTAELFSDSACTVAEGPRWNGAERTLYWVDITAGEVMRQRFDAPANRFDRFAPGLGKIGAVEFAPNGRLLLFAERCEVCISEFGGVPERKWTLPGHGDTRFNDVIDVGDGVFFCGVAPIRPSVRGELWRFDSRTGEFACVESATNGMPNGMGLSPDRKTFYFVVNLGEKREITLSGWETSPRGARLYLYDSANPRLNPFGDLPSADCVLTPDGGAVRFEIPENGMAFVTTDYVERVPAPVKDVKVADGRLTWTPVDDPDHCYYRVYKDGNQIASTVATSLPVKTDDVSSLTVKSVDKWGNEGR